MKYLWIILLCTLSYAGDYFVTDFSLDYDGDVVDSLNLGDIWPGRLSIAPFDNQYSILVDTNLNDGPLPTEVGAIPIVKYSEPQDQFFVVFTSRDSEEPVALVADNIFVFLRKYQWNSIFLNQIAQDTIGFSETLSSLDGNNYPPKTLDMALIDTQFVAIWGSHNNLSVRWVNDTRLSQNFSSRSKYIDENDGDEIDVTENGGYPALDVVPGGDLEEAIVAYEISGDPKRIVIRKQGIRGAGVTVIDTILEPTNTRALSMVVRSNSTGNSLVLWYGDGDDNIYGVAYDNTLTQLGTFPMTQITNTGDVYGKNIQQALPRQKFFDAIAIDTDKYIVVYGKSNFDLFWRTIDISTGVVGVEQSLVSGNYQLPSLTITDDYFAFAYFEDKGGGNYSLKTTLHNIVGVTPNRSIEFPAFLDTTAVAWDISFANSINQKGVHGLNAPSIAVDTLGDFVVGFNHELDARLAGWRNVYFYKDSATFTSRDLLIATPTVTEAYDPLFDEVQLDSVRFGLDSNVFVRWRQSIDGAYTNPADTFITMDSIGNPKDTIRQNGGHFEYQIMLANDNFDRITPIIDSLHFYWNVRPRVPYIDSIQVGSRSWQNFHPDTIFQVMNRLETTTIKFRAFDFDNTDSLWAVASKDGVPLDTVVLLQGSNSNPGWMEGLFVIPIETNRTDTMLLQMHIYDNTGWHGVKDTVKLHYYNSLPQDSIEVMHLKNDEVRDTNFVYPNSMPYHVLVGDTTWITLWAQDSNDNELNVFWTNTKKTVNDSGTMMIGDSFRFFIRPSSIDTNPRITLPVGQIDLTIDTVTIMMIDSNDTIQYPLYIVPNHHPSLDSIKTIGYMNPDVLVDTLIDENVDLKNDAYLGIIPYTPAVVFASASDVDAVNSDETIIKWGLLSLDSLGFCCNVLADSIATGDTLIFGDEALERDTLKLGPLTIAGATKLKEFFDFPPLLWIETKDKYGAFTEDTVFIRYPRLDTTLVGMNRFGEALIDLDNQFDLIIGAQKQKDTVIATITSTGTDYLRISDIKTSRDQSNWLRYVLTWRDSNETPQALEVGATTDSSPIDMSSIISIPKGGKLAFNFIVDVSNIRGDSIILDTLVLKTNDFFNHSLRIPIRIVYNDLPVMTLTRITNNPEDTSIIANELPKMIPQNSSFAFAFSEPVVKSDVLQYIQVYSHRDSIARGEALPPLMQSLTDPTQLRIVPHAGKDGSIFNDFVDSAYFTPEYKVPGDSIDLTPLSNSFVQGDSIHIWVGNSIRDSTGNTLDLKMDRVFRSAGSFDSVFTTRIDTSSFQVDTARLSPKLGGVFNVDNPVLVYFDNRLVVNNIFGVDTIKSLDLKNLASDSNYSLEIRTSFNSWNSVPMKSISLVAGDSALRITPKRKFFAGDSIHVIIKSNVSSISGNSLDGNFNGTGNFLYNRLDTLDRFIYPFKIGEASFYTFPNPFKYKLASHRELDGIVFKNLNNLKGTKPEQDIDIRIYSVTGQLVYSSKRKKNSVQFLAGESSPEWKWNLKNHAGRRVATGVYLFTIKTKDKLLDKGKVVLIR